MIFKNGGYATIIDLSVRGHCLHWVSMFGAGFLENMFDDLSTILAGRSLAFVEVSLIQRNFNQTSTYNCTERT